MPIDYKEYHPKWKLISRLIRFKRAGNRCEWCGRTNGQIIDKETGKYPIHSKWEKFHRILYNPHSGFTYNSLLKHFGFTKIVLTVAHVDQDKSNNRFSNLAALCQRCHLNHDRKHHIHKRIYGNNINQLSLIN
ncbi:MAG: hypothetical protein M9949_04970 [Candidatus Kapabacteria bacterium]|nr:hypothetical protein [Candidatus Kapabacteria bacterium]